MKTLKAAPEVEDQEHIFSYLPPEIILNILSRIPIRTVFTCKCVSKSWLELLESPEFARSHLANSVPGFLIYHLDDTNDTDILRIFGFEDSLEVERHYKRVLQLKSESTLDDSAPSISAITGSTNGLLCFQKAVPDRDDYYICNPITHECLRLPKPEVIPGRSGTIVADGFGASRSSNQYKVVVIFLGFVCQVYTLGTRSSWRSVRAPREVDIDCFTGRLVNGNLHWLTVEYSTGTQWISRFDIETEVFTKFRPPKLGLEGPPMDIGVLGDRLCAFESSTNEIVVYVMTDDGHGKESWNKEYVFRKIPPVSCWIGAVYPDLKAFGDDGLLLTLDYVWLLCSSTRTEAVELVSVLYDEVEGYSDAIILYTPSFISLRDFETENAKLSEFVCSMS